MGESIMRVLCLASLATGLALFAIDARAADKTSLDEGALSAEQVTVPETSADKAQSRWSLDIENAYLAHDIQNPWYLISLRDDNTKNFRHYHLETTVIGARYDWTHTGGWRFLRGNVQVGLGAFYSDVLQGPETHFIGALVGLRYVFVPGDGTWCPYAELRGSIGGTDSSGAFYGQQRDLFFGYNLGFGMRYQPDRLWRFSLGVEDQHASDGYATSNNFGFDATGPHIGVERML